MIKNYLKVALRNMTKHKLFSVINILGLSVGIAGCLFIVMYTVDELSYDQFHTNSERIYRMNLHGKLSGQEVYTSTTSPPMAKTMVDEVPEVEATTRIWGRGQFAFRYEEKAFTEDKIMAVDSNFFQFFDFKLLEGDAQTALTAPNSLVLTQSLATKYFGDDSALGELMIIGNKKDSYKVTGVAEDTPGNSHVKFNALLSMSSFEFGNNNNWLSNSLYTYYLLREGASLDQVDLKMEPIVERNVSPALQEFMGKSIEEFKADGGIYTYFSFPLEDLHLYSEVDHEPEPAGDIKYVSIMVAIGIFILIIACINFMNLSTAKSAGRAKEVGLRKTLGSVRSHLIGQFLSESLLYSLFAALLAYILVYTLLPGFNQLAGKELNTETLSEPLILGVGISIVFLVGLVAGSYPAFYLTSFKVTEVLKGKVRSGMKSGGVRSFLVAFQFWISIILIICTGIIYNQLQYIQNKNLGMDKEHVLVIDNASRLDNSREAYKDALSANSIITSTSYTNNAFPGVNNNTVFRAAGSQNDHIMGTYWADYDHQKTLGIEMVEGRFFSRDFPSDSMATVINEAAVRELGWENPLEHEIVDFNNDGGGRNLRVIGVMKDFNYESLKEEVRPLILKLTEKANVLLVRFQGQDASEVVRLTQEEWDKYAPNEPFEYTFLDDDFDKLFRSEQRLGTVFTVFTTLAILIACLGLFGLAAFTAEQRTKEIGIRKAMGASIWSITTLLSSEFTKLVLIAFVLAIYPAYYVMDSWLQGFANRIDLSVWVFAVSGIVALIIAWLTVSYHALKAARVNPVKSLRYE